jgi:RecA/RadA recombinase
MPEKKPPEVKFERNLARAPLTHVPTRIAPLDIHLYGGIPDGRITLLYGPPKSGKTTLAAHICKEIQYKYPDKAIVWYAAEDKFDEDYFTSIGVDCSPERLIVYPPKYLEETGDIMKHVVRKELDIAAQITDSLRGLSSSGSIAKSLDQAEVGVDSRVTNRLIRHLVTEQAERLRAGNPCSIILINHEREVIGSKFPVYEVTGGRTQIYAAATRLQFKNLYATKGEVVTQDEAKHQRQVELHYQVQGSLGGPGKGAGIFSVYQYASDGYRPGQVNSMDAWSKYGRRCQYITGKGDWQCGDRTYAGKEGVFDAWREDDDLYRHDTEQITKQMIAYFQSIGLAKKERKLKIAEAASEE